MSHRPEEQDDDDESMAEQPDLLGGAREAVSGFFRRLRRQLRRASFRQDEDDDWDQEVYEERQARFERDAAALAGIIDEVCSNLEHMRDTMRRSYAAQTLRQRASYFENLAGEFIDIKRNRKDPLHHFACHTPEREAALEQVIDTALMAATRFEEYSDNPESFSRVRARSSIRDVLAALRNLDPTSEEP